MCKFLVNTFYLNIVWTIGTAEKKKTEKFSNVVLQKNAKSKMDMKL